MTLELTYRIGNVIIAAVAKEFMQNKVSALTGHPEVEELIQIVVDYRRGVIPASVVGDWVDDHGFQDPDDGERWHEYLDAVDQNAELIRRAYDDIHF